MDFQPLIPTTDQFTDEIGALIRMDLFQHPESAEDVTAQNRCNILGCGIPSGVSFQPSGKGIFDCDDMGVSLGERPEGSHEVD